MTEFPRTFGPYQLLAEIARGASGFIYRARRLDGGPEIALKALRDDHPDAAAKERFERESRMAARLDHPHLVPVLDAGDAGGRLYYTMPIIHGRPLEPGSDPAAIAGLVEKVARAVHHAHERGVIHRDLKPANILVQEDGEPLVTDFGIARDQHRATQLTTAGELLGTPAYMAPEQIVGRAHTATARTDVHALGAVLYFALSGRPPFDAVTFAELSAQILHDEPMPIRSLAPHVEEPFAAIVHRCLRKNPDERFASARDLADALASVCRSARPRRLTLGSVASAAAVLAAAGSMLAGGSDRPSSPPLMVRTGSAWIERTEVSAEEYARFIAATGRKPPPTWRHARPPRGKERRPVTHVTREDAAAYAAWTGRRLPTVDELRSASAGIERLDSRSVVCAPEALDTGPVDVDRGTDVASIGALHLGGNVAEWTSTPSPGGDRLGVVFGGHWKSSWTHGVRGPVEELPADTRDGTIGFRCAADDDGR